jgi:hypothetical protein
MWQTLFADNPLLIKHIRTRLRRQHLLPGLAVVVIISGLITWAGFPQVTENTGPNDLWQARAGAFLCLIILQGLLLLLVGSASVAGSVAQARESGMMDFHRISPQRPVALALGFLLGGPIREYLLFAATLPFAAVLLLWRLSYTPISQQGDVNFSLSDPLHAIGYLKVLLILLILGLLYHCFALLCGLVMPKTRGIAASMVSLLLILQCFLLAPGIQSLTVSPTLFTSLRLGDLAPEGISKLSFYGLPLSAFLLALLHAVPLLIFLFMAVVRKMRHERAYALAKPYAVLLFALLCLLIIGDAMPASPPIDEWPAIFFSQIVLFSTLLLGLLLCLCVSPNAGDMLKGVRHAGKLGLSHVPAWNDLAVNWAPVLAMSGMTLISGMTVTCMSKSHLFGAYSACYNDWTVAKGCFAILIAALALLFFGLMKQYFDLRFKKNGMVYFVLLLFLLWVVPLLLALVCTILTHDEAQDLIHILGGVSPLGGIGYLGDEQPLIISLCIVGALTIFSVPLYIGAVKAAKARN